MTTKKKIQVIKFDEVEYEEDSAILLYKGEEVADFNVPALVGDHITRLNNNKGLDITFEEVI